MRASTMQSGRARLRLRPYGLAAFGIAAALTTAAPFALAQTGGGKGTTPAPASTWSSATTTTTTTAPPSGGSGDATATATAEGDGPKATSQVVEPPSEAFDNSDVTELPGKSYYFVGVRYRGTVVPQFMLNLFVNEGTTIYTNTVGLEIDMRKDGFSFIPALSFVEYGMPDTMFHEKNKNDFAGNWSHVSSQLKGIYATADLLWSAKISKNVDFEYGAGFGLGVIFGDLNTNWVYRDDAAGTYRASNGHGFSPCMSEGQGGAGSGCNKADHQNATVAKVNGYDEPSWANGGSKPNVFLHLAIPQLGVRIKPVKQFEARVGLGFSLTGFWFGLSGNYGLEKRAEKK